MKNNSTAQNANVFEEEELAESTQAHEIYCTKLAVDFAIQETNDPNITKVTEILTHNLPSLFARMFPKEEHVPNAMLIHTWFMLIEHTIYFSGHKAAILNGMNLTILRILEEPDNIYVIKIAEAMANIRPSKNSKLNLTYAKCFIMLYIIFGLYMKITREDYYYINTKLSNILKQILKTFDVDLENHIKICSFLLAHNSLNATLTALGITRLMNNTGNVLGFNKLESDFLAALNFNMCLTGVLPARLENISPRNSTSDGFTDTDQLKMKHHEYEPAEYITKECAIVRAKSACENPIEYPIPRYKHRRCGSC